MCHLCLSAEATDKTPECETWTNLGALMLRIGLCLEGQIANRKTLAIWTHNLQIAFQLLVDMCLNRKSHD